MCALPLLPFCGNISLAVPLWMVSQKHMAKLLKHYRGRFSNGECLWGIMPHACMHAWPGAA